MSVCDSRSQTDLEPTSRQNKKEGGGIVDANQETETGFISSL